MLGGKKTNDVAPPAAPMAENSNSNGSAEHHGAASAETVDNSTPIKPGKFNLKKMVKKFPVTMLTPGKDRSKEKNGAQQVRKSDSGRPELADISNPDERSFDACDLLFHDCEELLKLSSKTISFTKKTNASNSSKLNVASKINKWRAKRKESSLSVTYESLQARVEQVEAQLQAYADQAVKSTSTLVVQALHLNMRLNACIQFNRQELEVMDPQLQSGQLFMNQLKATEVALENMIKFAEMLDLMKRNEPQPYIPWAQRMAVQKERERQEALEKERLEQARAKGGAEEDATSIIDPAMMRKRLRKVKRVRAVLPPPFNSFYFALLFI